MRNLSRHVKEFSRLQSHTPPRQTDLERARQALHRDVASDPMRRQRLAGAWRQAQHLEIARLEQRDAALGRRPLRAMQGDDFTGLHVMQGHGHLQRRRVEAICLPPNAGERPEAPRELQ
ncbi:MAG: hypothetical protein ACK5XM_06345 [Betaproteobacteria bacterium]